MASLRGFRDQLAAGILLAACSVPCLLYAETITLKNGTVIEGEIIGQGRDSVTIRTPLGTQRISKDQIRRISHSQADGAKKENERKELERKENERKKAEEKELERKTREQEQAREKAEELKRKQALEEEELSRKQLEAARLEQEKSRIDAQKALEDSRKREAEKAEQKPEVLTPANAGEENKKPEGTSQGQEEEQAKLVQAREQEEKTAAQKEKAAAEERMRAEKEAALQLEKLREQRRADEQAMLQVRYGSVVSAGFVSGVTRTLAERRTADLLFRRDLFFGGRWAETESSNHRTQGGSFTYRYLRPSWMCILDFTAASAKPQVSRMLYGALTDTGAEVFFPLSIDQSSTKLSIVRAMAAGGISILPEEGPMQFYGIAGVRTASTDGSVSRTAGTITGGLISGSIGISAEVPLEESIQYKSTLPFAGVFWRMQFPSRAEVWFMGGAGIGNGRYAFLKTGFTGGGLSILREEAALSRRETFGALGGSFPLLDNDVRLFASVHADSATSKFATAFSQAGPGAFDAAAYFSGQYAAQTARGYTETSAGLRMGVEIRL